MAIGWFQRASFSVLWAATSVCSAATLDFGSFPVPTLYGRQNNTPGDVVYTSPEGIRMSVENFFFSSQSFTGFVRGEVGGGGLESYFPTRPLFLDNLSARFDFSQLGFAVDRVSVEYLELGGLNNFSVNGRPIIEITPLDDLPTDVAPGVTLINEVLDATSGRSRITLVGDIDSVLIGGQELGINTIVAVPEPASLALLGLGLAPFAWRRFRSARH